MRHAAVSLAAVIGVEERGARSSPRRSSSCAAGVEPKPATSSRAELQEFVKARLAKHKYPRLIEFVDDVPKNDRGKVDRRALMAREGEVTTLRTGETPKRRMNERLHLAALTTEEIARGRRRRRRRRCSSRWGASSRTARTCRSGPTRSSARRRRAAPRVSLRERGVAAFVAPSVPYGVTDFAAGFAGAIGVAGASAHRVPRARSPRASSADGWSHVCLVNNHLEPAHDAAVRAAIAGLAKGRASVACPLTRRWARTLSDEFKRGNCHAGRYETSLVLAAGGRRAATIARACPRSTSASPTASAPGKTTFRAMGLDRAYTGAPAEATPRRGRRALRAARGDDRDRGARGAGLRGLAAQTAFREVRPPLRFSGSSRRYRGS